MAGKKQSLLKKFMAKVLIVPSGHWYWTGSKGGNNYGRMTVNGKYIGAHVVAYKLFKGLVPAGHDVHHECERTDCVNPEHLKALPEKEHVQLHLKTHCANGHLLTGANVYHWSGNNARYCRACRRAIDKRRPRRGLHKSV